jgi:hypothetical protein
MIELFGRPRCAANWTTLPVANPEMDHKSLIGKALWNSGWLAADPGSGLDPRLHLGIAAPATGTETDVPAKI